MKVSQSRVVADRWSAALKRLDLGCRSASPRSSLTRVIEAHRKLGMDMTWVTGRIAVGGGIWADENMSDVAKAGVTHIIDMQAEFDDTLLAKPYGIKVLWNATDDDFQPKPAELLQRGVDFALEALDEEGTKLFIHCAAGVHRAPMMALAVLSSLSWSVEDAMQLIEARRPVVDFAEVYVQSVENFLQTSERGKVGLQR
jgi:protein-tyrosine phosphatase